MTSSLDALQQLRSDTARAATAAEAIADQVPKAFQRLEKRIELLERRVAKLEGKKPAKKKVPK